MRLAFALLGIFLEGVPAEIPGSRWERLATGSRQGRAIGPDRYLGWPRGAVRTLYGDPLVRPAGRVLGVLTEERKGEDRGRVFCRFASGGGPWARFAWDTLRRRGDLRAQRHLDRVPRYHVGGIGLLLRSDRPRRVGADPRDSRGGPHRRLHGGKRPQASHSWHEYLYRERDPECGFCSLVQTLATPDRSLVAGAGVSGSSLLVGSP